MVLEKARELGEEIKETDEYEQLQKAERRLSLDTTAQEILEEVQQIQVEAQQAQMQGQPVGNDLQQRLQQLQMRMRQNDTITQLVEAQQEFNDLLGKVNEEITKAITPGQGKIQPASPGGPQVIQGGKAQGKQDGPDLVIGK